VDKTDKNMLKVAYSQEWSSSRYESSSSWDILLLTNCREKTHEGIKEVVKPFDWSYTTDYKGTITNGKPFESQGENADPIPIELLKRPDPILFFEEVVLYESELDDNGISVFSCKLRVMPDRMLLLCRLFMRLDSVLIRIRDTRIYVDFNTGKIIRDYTEKEDNFDTVKEVGSILYRVRVFLLTTVAEPFVWWQAYKRSHYCSAGSQSACELLTTSEAYFGKLNATLKFLARFWPSFFFYLSIALGVCISWRLRGSRLRTITME
jgi:type 2A phosphatase activator TIP41